MSELPSPTREPASAENPRLLVLVVNYRVGALTVDCLTSLEPELAAYPGSRVVVVDNASGDDSVPLLESWVGQGDRRSWVSFVRSEENLGFAGGNNLALRHGQENCEADYILLLNPDTVVRPGAIRVLVDFVEARPAAGIAGGRSEDPDATPQHCCFRFPNLVNEFSSHARVGPVDRFFRRRICRVPISDEPHRIDWVSGACMLLRREVVDQVGLFDDRYFLYFEETDLALQAARAGWECWHVPGCRIVHLVGFSSGVTRRDTTPKRKPTYWFESRRHYFVKNHGRIYALAADALAFAGSAVARCRSWLSRRPSEQPPCFLRDLVRHSVLLNVFRP